MSCIPSRTVVCAAAPDPHAFAQVHPLIGCIAVFAVLALVVCALAIPALLAAEDDA